MRSPGRWQNFDRQAAQTSTPVPVHTFEIITTENTEDHGIPQEFFTLEHHTLTERIIGLAIEVHRTVGPGPLESVFAEYMALELAHAGISFESQVTVPVIYKGITIPLGFRADVIVENTVILELKAVAALLPAHDAQLLTYLRLSHLRVGLLLNFHSPSRYPRRTPQNSGNAAFTMSVMSDRNAVGWNNCPRGMHGNVSSARN
jgi:GxxExxY protein